VEAVKIDTAARVVQKVEDFVAVEKPIHIFIGRSPYATILCTPVDLNELVVGHLLSEGIVRAVDEIHEISFREESLCYVNLKPTVDIDKRLRLLKRIHRIIPSTCGGLHLSKFLKGTKPIKSAAKVKAEILQRSVASLNVMAETFRKTGGVHAAAIYTVNGELLAFAEDIGRHNAVDKAFGKAALKNALFSNCFLVLSGRLSGDIVLKAVRVGIPIVASIAAALDSGIEIARKANLTLVGFVREGNMKVYNAPERIIF